MNSIFLAIKQLSRPQPILPSRISAKMCKTYTLCNDLVTFLSLDDDRLRSLDLDRLDLDRSFDLLGDLDRFFGGGDGDFEICLTILSDSSDVLVTFLYRPNIER